MRALSAQLPARTTAGVAAGQDRSGVTPLWVLFIAVWAGCCLTGLALAVWREQVLVGIFIAGVPSLVGMIAKPTFALCCITLMLTMGGSLVYEGIVTGDKVVGGVAALGILVNFLVTGKGISIRGSPLVPLFLIAAWGVASIGWATYPGPALRAALRRVQLVIWGLAVWIALAHGKDYIWPLRCYAGGMLGVVCQMFFTGSVHRMARAAERMTIEVTTAINPADFAVLLLLWDPVKWLRPVYLVSAFIFPALMVQTGSRGPLLALGAAMAASVFSFSSFMKSKAMLIGTSLMVVLFAGGTCWSLRSGFVSETSVERLTSSHERGSAAAFRGYLAKTGVQRIMARPLTGTGLGNYLLVGFDRTTVHTEILFLGTELGIPAVLLYTWYVWKLTAAFLKTKSPPERWFLRTMLIFLVLEACVHVMFFKKIFWFFTIGAAAICYRARQAETVQPAYAPAP
jgi:hypothetical protein